MTKQPKRTQRAQDHRAMPPDRATRRRLVETTLRANPDVMAIFANYVEKHPCPAGSF
jgi:hypothetical protein